MKSSLGYLLVASALVASPTIALAEDAVEPAATAAPETPAAAVAPPEPAPAPAPAETPAPLAPLAPSPSTQGAPDTPALTDAPDAVITLGDGRAPQPLDETDPSPRTPGAPDAAPDLQATESSLIAPSALDLQAIPNFFVEDFDIPPFLLPIYQAAGSEYGIRWEVLAAINRVETAFGTNLNVSSAGALGWMQFMPATWKTYGVDANGDGLEDPFNPADAIFAAARYLKAAGGDQDLRKAIFAYNHADWYVEMVMDGASRIAAIPQPVITSLTALTQGTFPVDAADDAIDYRGKVAVAHEQPSAGDRGETDRDRGNRGERADETGGGGGDTADGVRITAPVGARIVAAQDGVVEAVGRSERLGSFVRVRDAAGNRYTYAQLGDVAAEVAVPRGTVDADDERDAEHEHGTSADDAHAGAGDPAATTPQPTTPEQTSPAATTPRSTPVATTADVSAPPKRRRGPRPRVEATAEPASASPHLATPEYARRDLTQPDPVPTDTAAAQLANAVAPTGSLAQYFSIDYGFDADDVRLVPLQPGVRLLAGTVLGRVTDAEAGAGLRFEIRPAGAAAPRIDPRPILDGWRLMDRTAFYRARQRANATSSAPADASATTAGQVLLMSKAELQQRVLADGRISVYGCGRSDIKSGAIDRRILALLEYLAIKGVRPTVTSLQCGHGHLTASGNVSEHSTGSAVDIGSVYGSVISPATQGLGSPTDRAVREILALQGAMKPHQIITLMKYPDAANTLAMADHDDHIHVGYHPEGDQVDDAPASAFDPKQWRDLVKHLRAVKTPKVAAGPSRYSVTVGTTPRRATPKAPARKRSTPGPTTPTAARSTPTGTTPPG